ncbi:MAG: HTTM domain-containing protein [Rhodothermales bacterium]|nr:HTTM domain-containing protein [Rhodothermales bacterium]
MQETREIISGKGARLRKEVGRHRSTLAAPIDAAPLAYFRIVFGAIMVWEVYRYWSKGWIERYYIEPEIFFTYPGFGWVAPWEGVGMHMHFAVLGVLAAFVALGLAYRLAAPLFALGFWYVFLLDQSNYLNHFYLIGLLATIMAFLPANRWASLDAVLSPQIKKRWVPAWTLRLIQFQLAVAYFFGGVAKINGDWLAGRPMNDWLQGSGDVFLVGPFLESSMAPLVLSWGGLLFDLLIVPAVMWKRTRVPAVLAIVAFHLTNSAVFSIGIFPWFMLAATPVFFPTPWKGWRPASLPSVTPLRSSLGLVLAAFVLWQVIMPFRHLAYPGNVSWTEEGHNFAWHMKLRDKRGRISFTAVDPSTGHEWEFDHTDYLSSRQARKMRVRPALMAQFARKIQPRLERELAVSPLAIRARASVSLNGRPRAILVDPEVDLTTAEWGLAPSRWVLPLPNFSTASE